MLEENLFLILLGLIWISVAVIMDFKKREIPNWWNFSLIAVALAYRAFVSLSLRYHKFFIFGLLGFAVFFIIANIFYYSRIFAGGDAKLLMGLGAVLPFLSTIKGILAIFFYYVFLILLFGGIYGLFYSLVLVFRNKKSFSKEFLKQFELRKKMIDYFVITSVVLAVVFVIIGEKLLVLFPLLFLIFPFLYIYSKSIEESCMIKSVSSDKLTLGDWLYEEVKVGKKKIKPNWEGLNEQQLKLLKKSKKKVKIKEGIPFTPAFLFAFLVLIWLLI